MFDYEKQPVKAVVSNVTATRAIDGTIYQNTSGRPILCELTLRCSQALADEQAYADAYVEDATPPTVIVGRVGLNAKGPCDIYTGFSFFIPNESYYKVTNTTTGGGAVVLHRWCEVEL